MESADGTLVARLELRLIELEKRVAFLEGQAPITSTPAETPQPQMSGSVLADGSEASLCLDDWDYQYSEHDSGHYYSIRLKLRNTGTRHIKLLDASVSFADLLDQSLYGINISPDVAIPPGTTYADEGEYRINQFNNEQLRMKNLSKSDIKAVLRVRRIVFSDNSVLQLLR
jgi:hypothetical protein